MSKRAFLKLCDTGKQIAQPLEVYGLPGKISGAHGRITHQA